MTIFCEIDTLYVVTAVGQTNVKLSINYSVTVEPERMLIGTKKIIITVTIIILCAVQVDCAHHCNADACFTTH